MGMREHDDAAIRVVGRDLVGPRQHYITRPELQREQQPVHSAGAEQVVAIVHPIGFKHPAERRKVLELAQGKELVEQGRQILALIESVMIAHRQRVRHHAIQQTDAGLGVGPFRCVVIIGNVAFVQNKNNVRVVLVINNPLGLRRKNLTRAAGNFMGVILGVRQRHEGERLILRNQRYRDALVASLRKSANRHHPYGGGGLSGGDGHCAGQPLVIRAIRRGATDAIIDQQRLARVARSLNRKGSRLRPGHCGISGGLHTDDRPGAIGVSL